MENALLLLLGSLLSAALSVTLYGPCPHLKKCSCRDDDEVEGGILIACKRITDEDMHEIPLHNVTAIRITHSHFKDPSVLRYLRTKGESKNALALSLMYTEVKHFSWGWMPSNTERVTLSGTDTIDFYSQEQFGRDGSKKYECDMAHIKNPLGLTIIRQRIMKTIPACLPSTLRSFGIHRTDLSRLKNPDYGVVKWPNSLRILYLANNNISTLADGIFSEPPFNLSRITLKDQPISDGSILLALPSKTLLFLRIQNTSLKVVLERHFKRFRDHGVLRTFAISASRLERIPKGIPSSVKNLDLNSNRITTLKKEDFAQLKNLKWLDLRRNLFHTIPPILPKSLEKIDFEHNKITSCHAEAFVGMSNLTILLLSHNSLKTMPKNVPKNLLHYSVFHNQISDIGPESNYDFCTKCTMFNIGNNPWACNTHMINFLLWTNRHRNRTHIDTDNAYALCGSGISDLNDMVLQNIMYYIQVYRRKGCFYNVTVLNCTANHMTRLPKMYHTIKRAYVVDNPALGSIPKSLFAHHKDLTELELRNVGLTRIPEGLPQSILSLNLADNNVTDISNKDVESLKNLTNIITIDLSNNGLATLLLQQIQHLSTLKLIILKGNPLICDCNLWPYTIWARHQRVENDVINYETEEPGIRGTCTAPVTIAGVDVTQLYEYYEYDKPCMPKNCYWNMETPLINCSYAQQMALSGNRTVHLPKMLRIPPSYYWESVDLSGLKLTSLDVQLGHLGGLTEVKLSNNSLNVIPMSGLPRTVTELILDNNNISSLPTLEGLRRHFNKLECLDLHNNSIRYLNENDVRLFPFLKKLRLHDNPLVCDCKLGPLVAWIAANNDNPSVMRNHDLEKLECYGPIKLAGRLIANLTAGEYCPTVNVGAVTGGLVGAVVFLIILAVVCNVYMHRQCKIREKEAILQGFRELLQQEADFDDADADVANDGRFRYDAFVSYSPHDEDTEFANILLEMLEVTHNYNLCVHERDFVPGVGIADNIVECIGASKRIILILSQNFVSSPWCQYEVQVALTELHQKRKSKLLIPILLEELDDNVEGTIKTFLSLIKGIKIPSNDSHSSWKQFWDEIIKAMPEEPISEDAVRDDQIIGEQATL